MEILVWRRRPNGVISSDGKRGAAPFIAPLFRKSPLLAAAVDEDLSTLALA